MNSSESDKFIKKIFQLFEQVRLKKQIINLKNAIFKILFFSKMIKDLVKDEDMHVKFVDAFLNLVSRVLNLPVK